MSFPPFPYQDQLSINAPSFMASPATQTSMGLPPPPMQPKPNAEQLAILRHIKQRLPDDPDSERRFLYNFLAMQYVDDFQRRVIKDKLLGQGSADGVRVDVEQELLKNLTGQEKAYLHPFLNVQLDVVRSWLQGTAIPGSGRLQVGNTAPAHGRGPSVSLSASRSPSRNSPRGSRSGSRAPAPDHRLRYTCGEHFFGKTCEQCRKGYLLEKGFTTHVWKEHLQGVPLAYIAQTKEQCCRDNATDVQTLLNHIRISHMGQFSPADLRKTSKHLSPWVVEALEDQSRRTSSATIDYTVSDTVPGAIPHRSLPTLLNTHYTNAESTPVMPSYSISNGHQSGAVPGGNHIRPFHNPGAQWSPVDYQQQPGYGSEGNSFYSPGPFQ